MFHRNKSSVRRYVVIIKSIYTRANILILGLRLHISQIMRPDSPRSPLTKTEEHTEEDADEDTGEEGVEVGNKGYQQVAVDWLFELQGYDFDEELAARIIVQDGLDGDEGHIDWNQDIANE